MPQPQCYVCKTRRTGRNYRRLGCGIHIKRGHHLCLQCRDLLETKYKLNLRCERDVVDMHGNLNIGQPFLYLDNCPNREFFAALRLEGVIGEPAIVDLRW